MVKTLTIKFTELTELGDNLIQSITEIETCLINLQKEVNSLNSVWEGPDSSAYVAKINKSLDNLAIIKSDLQSYGTFMKNTSTEYQEIIEKALDNLGKG